jgi:hypothetical protein
MNSEEIYTVILFFQGGTYIHQLVAHSAADAMLSWLDTFDNDITDCPESINLLKKTLQDEIALWAKEPLEYEGLENAWNMDTFVEILEEAYAEIIIIKTQNPEFAVIKTRNPGSKHKTQTSPSSNPD